MLRSTELLQAVADGTPDVVYIKDTDSRYVLCNRPWPTSPGGLSIRSSAPATSLVQPAEAAPLLERDRQMFATNSLQTTEKWLTGREAGHACSTRRARRTAMRRVTVIGVIGIARDITTTGLPAGAAGQQGDAGHGGPHRQGWAAGPSTLRNSG
jgi:PAS domain-containing protein